MSRSFCTLSHSLREPRNVPLSLVFSSFRAKAKCVASSLLWESRNSVSSGRGWTPVRLNEAPFLAQEKKWAIKKQLAERCCVSIYLFQTALVCMSSSVFWLRGGFPETSQFPSLPCIGSREHCTYSKCLQTKSLCSSAGGPKCSG